MKLNRALWAGVLAMMAAFPVTTLAANAQELTKVTFSLDFIPLGRPAPW